MAAQAQVSKQPREAGDPLSFTPPQYTTSLRGGHIISGCVMVVIFFPWIFLPPTAVPYVRSEDSKGCRRTRHRYIATRTPDAGGADPVAFVNQGMVLASQRPAGGVQGDPR